MAFEFQRSSCVAAGTFNIYVIQPKWLSEVKILPSNLKVRVEADLKRPGFRLSSSDLPSEWQVRPDRLQVTSSDFHEDCGSKVAEVLGILKWTPIHGVGINVEFRADRSYFRELPRVQLIDETTFPSGYELRQRTWHRTVERDGLAFNLQLSMTEEATLLALNVHAELSQIQSHEEAANAGERACRAFLTHRKEIISLASQALGVELIHADDDDV